MNTALTNPEDTFSIGPAALELVQTYMETEFSIEKTSEILEMPYDEVVSFLGKREVKRFLDNVYFQQGYMNRFKLNSLLTKVIESKLEEAEESGVYTGKDLVDVLTLMHKISSDQQKLINPGGPAKQTNVQVNNYESPNLSSTIERIVKGE